MAREKGGGEGGREGKGGRRLWRVLVCACNMHALEVNVDGVYLKKGRGGVIQTPALRALRHSLHLRCGSDGTAPISMFTLPQSHNIITDSHPCIAISQWICWHGDQ